MKKQIFPFIVWVVSIFCPLFAFAGTFTIPDWVMRSCVFVMKDDKAAGTGFLIGVKVEGGTFCYFVTAKHVIQPALQNISKLHLRLNKKDGSGAEVVEFNMISFNGKA
jgi:hypothetical protein